MNKRKRFHRKEFDVKLLDQLAQDEGSCVHVHKLQYHLALHPFQLNDLNTSVKDILNQEVAKYSSRLDGILFGYKNIKFLSKLGEICEDSCFIHVDIEADFFIFKPLEGKTLQGVVNKISKDHVGCLVHKLFNVALPKSTHSKNWLGSSVGLNSEILFTINYTNFEGKLPYIRGEITSVLSNPAQDDSELNFGDETGHEVVKKGKRAKKLYFTDNEEAETVESELSPKKSKKRKKSMPEVDVAEVELNFEDENENVVRKKRKSSKILFENEPEAVEAESSPKKSRKRKKSRSEGDISEEVPIKRKRKKSKNYDEEQA